jgi:L-aminopeptidase/D-esterase-like protein
MQTIELVTFRLAPGTDRAAFLNNARRTEAAIRRQPGFQARMLTETPDGIWSDIVTWASKAQAMAAAKAIMADPDFAPFGAMIDMDSCRMSHATLVWQLS